ncbi:helix-turn-helix domain-containing protein [Tepidibacter sp. Z1-5]|uniref:helix-turn-helix domain-containing protein n=1 Tax=Tepidibacter sp. Z1-5 TaxID=3134138 RepID=UPI0030C597B4
MNKKKIFEKRGVIGKSILQIIKSEGYTKSSFAKMIGVSRPTLNQIIEGESPSETILSTQINKILELLNITLDELVNYKDYNQIIDTAAVAYSNNSPEDYIRSKSANNALEILDNVLDLYEIYYK